MYFLFLSHEHLPFLDWLLYSRSAKLFYICLNCCLSFEIVLISMSVIGWVPCAGVCLGTAAPTSLYITSNGSFKSRLFFQRYTHLEHFFFCGRKSFRAPYYFWKIVQTAIFFASLTKRKKFTALIFQRILDPSNNQEKARLGFSSWCIAIFACLQPWKTVRVYFETFQSFKFHILFHIITMMDNVNVWNLIVLI